MSAPGFLSGLARLRLLALMGWLLVVMCGANVCRVRAQDDTALQAVAQLNRVRLENGLAPLSISAALERAAQRHSDDQLRGNFLDDTGSDGSTGRDRMLAAGYAAWSGGRLIWGETLYVSSSGFAETLDFILNDPGQRSTLLSTRFREIGVAVAGNERQYWTLLYGAQPNVLPAFINDGSGITNDANVAVHLTQEEAMPAGEGNQTIGSVVEVRVSTNANFGDAAWQSWKPLLEARFDLKPGPKTIYVQYRDASGRSTVSAASIRYDPNATNTFKPFGPGAVPTAAAPSVAPTPISAQPTPTTAAAPTARPGEPVATPTAVTIGGNPIATLPSVTPPAQSAPPPSTRREAIPTAFVFSVDDSNAAEVAPIGDLPADEAPPEAIATPQAKPAPTTEATVAATSAPNLLDRDAIRRTLQAPLMAWLLPIYLVLQVGAIALGALLLLRRR